MNSKINSFFHRNKKIIFVLIVSTLLFYWFAWRPVDIRKSCAQESNEKYPGNPHYWDYWYGVCLKKKGLKE